MRTFSTGSTATALLLCISASAFAQPLTGSEDQPPKILQDGDEIEGVLAIPLVRRGANELTLEDGTVNWARFQSHLAKTTAKFVRTSDNFYLNTGEPLFKTIPVQDEPTTAEGANDLGRRSWSTPESNSLDWEGDSADVRYVNRPLIPRSSVPRQKIEKRDGNGPTTLITRSPKLGEKLFSPRFRGKGILGGMKGTTAKVVTNPKKKKPAVAAGSSSSGSSASSSAVDLTDYNNDMLWAGSLTIGTPAKPFVIDFDTGSGDLWVPDSSCTSAACAPHAKYDPNASSTSVAVPSKQLSVQYGDGSSTGGKVYSDTVSLAGLTATGQILGSATALSSDWGDDPMDGLMGMGYQSISQLGTPPFFQNLVGQGKTAAPQFSFKLSSSGSELYLGGMNSASFVAGSTEWSPVVSQSYWIVSATANVNGSPAGDGFSAIIDSGTSVIVAPTASAQAFWSSVPNSSVYGGGYYTFPCATPPTISFSFAGGSGKQWAISADNLNLGKVNSGSTRCVGSIVGVDVGVNAWILGGSFMKNVYTTFDLNQNAVGFSQVI